MPRPITATIHLAALAHNYAVARQHGNGARVWAVVKANAYGHGLPFALEAFIDADGLALVEVDGAVKIRAAGWSKPILLLEGFFHAADIPVIMQHQIDVVVHCAEQIELLEQELLENDDMPSHFQTPIRVHIKVNGGMNRLGFKPDAVSAAYQRLAALPTITVVELIMHFANADNPNNPRLPVSRQLEEFSRALATIGEHKLEISLANSAGTFLNPPVKTDWVRAGIMLYGGCPKAGAAKDYGLLPGMTLTSEVIAVQNLQAGDTIGYGSRYVAQQPMRIGVVACGYADGYPRHAPDGTPVLVNGIRTSMVGRVSMDMLTVDITGIPSAQVGSSVTLWGQGLPIDDVARAADTIGYELMCAVAQRVPLISDTGVGKT